MLALHRRAAAAIAGDGGPGDPGGGGGQFLYTSSEDGTVRKLDLDGNEEWSFDVIGDRVWCVEAADGYVYSGGIDNPDVHKIDMAAGTSVWSFAESSAVYGVAVDSAGNVYVASSGALRRLDSAGDSVWTKTNFSGEAVAVTADAADNAVFAASGSDDIIAVDADNNVLWTYGGHSNSVNNLTADALGNVFSVSIDETARKIDSDGDLVWSYDAGSQVYGVALDGGGNVIIGGSQFVHKLDPAGDLIWEKSGISMPGLVRSIACDSDNNIYLGKSQASIEVQKLDSDGNSQWTFGDHGDDVRAIAIA